MAPDGHFASRSAPFDKGTAEICQSPVDNPNGQDFSALLPVPYMYLSNCALHHSPAIRVSCEKNRLHDEGPKLEVQKRRTMATFTEGVCREDKRLTSWASGPDPTGVIGP